MKLRALWRDSVWSKVIAAAIVGAAGWTFSEWETVKKCSRALAIELGDALASSGQWLTSSWRVPIWLTLVVAVLVIVLVTSLVVLGRKHLGQRTAPVVAHPRMVDTTEDSYTGPAIGRPFADLSPQQQQLLIGQIRRGTRMFNVPHEISRLRWFEELCNWRYVAAQELVIYAGGPWPYEILEPAWEELERLQRAGQLVVRA